jgi:hypothetical protein
MPLGAHKAAIMGVAGTAVTGDVVLLYDTDHSDATTVSITSGIDSTYGEYIFRFYNINPATDNVNFGFQANAVGASGYNETMTTTVFRARHYEDDSYPDLLYDPDDDQGEGTAFQPLAVGSGNGADESAVGELHIFSPASTTYVKNFYATTNNYHNENVTFNWYVAGYFNITTAIDDIQFKMTSGNFDGTIKMWGVK